MEFGIHGLIYYMVVFALAMYGEVPKMAEGTPLERVQVVNSGARVQIPPSPFRRQEAAQSFFIREAFPPEAAYRFFHINM